MRLGVIKKLSTPITFLVRLSCFNTYPVYCLLILSNCSRKFLSSSALQITCSSSVFPPEAYYINSSYRRTRYQCACKRFSNTFKLIFFKSDFPFYWTNFMPNFFCSQFLYDFLNLLQNSLHKIIELLHFLIN